MLCRMMRDKIRVLGAALYCVRTDIAYLMQNQKAITRYRPGSRRHFLSEILQRCGHRVTTQQTDEWIHNAIMANVNDDANRTIEQKKKRIKRKHNKFLKSFGDGRECLNHYKSGGKKIKQDPDLLQDSQDKGADVETESYPATEMALKKFSIGGLKTITLRVLKSVHTNVVEATQHIPITGRGQKQAWMTLLLELVAEHNISTLSAPIEGNPKPQPNANANPYPYPTRTSVSDDTSTGAGICCSFAGNCESASTSL